MCPYASCTDCCIVHSTSVGADPELVGGVCGWSCMLLLHPVPTCADADAGPDLCTLHPDLVPCACGGCHKQQLTLVVFLPQLLAQILHLHMLRFHPLQLLVVFFLPLTGADTVFTLEPLALFWCFFWWWWYTYVNVMVVVVAMGWFHPLQCGVFPSTAGTYTVLALEQLALYGGWWLFCGGGGRCTLTH